MAEFLVALLISISGTAAAPDPAKPSHAEERDKDKQTRINVAAGPHKQFKPEGASERQAGRGASRAEGLESRNARDARRP